MAEKSNFIYPYFPMQIVNPKLFYIKFCSLFFFLTILNFLFLTGSSFAGDTDKNESGCFMELRKLVSVIDSEFDRPITRKVPIFFGLFSYAEEDYEALPENIEAVKRAAPISNCKHIDVIKAALTSKHSPRFYYYSENKLNISWSKKYKTAHFFWYRQKSEVTSSEIVVRKWY